MLRTPRVTTLLVALALVMLQVPVPTFAAVSISGDTTFSFELQAGINSLGTMRIDGGSEFTAQGGMRLGYQQFGVGLVTVTGQGSQLNFANSSNTEIGVAGYGKLEILDGALVNQSGTSGQFRIASSGCCSSGGSYGAVIVDGPGSALLLSNDLFVGTNGIGLLSISNGALVNAIQSQTQISGRLEMNGGLFRTSDITNNGVVTGSGEISTGQISGFGRFEANAGQTLRITGISGDFSNSGIIAVNGGEISFSRGIDNIISGPNAGEMTLRNGVMHVGVPMNGTFLQNSSVLAAIGGVNDFYGRIQNLATGRIAVTNNSVMIFHDDVTADDGVITVFPGSSAVFLEDLEMNGSSVLLADLAGSDDDSGFGEIEVVGNAQLNSSLSITLADGFTPSAGDEFPILAASSISGALALGDVADLPTGLKWDLEQEANRVVLSVVPGLAGDYNNDGAVDSADYILWRKMYGQQGDDLAADGNDNGRVDDGDHVFWQAHFGNTLAEVGGTSESVVPEPAGLALFLTSLVLVICRRWKLN